MGDNRREWQPIALAPSGRWLIVSMRDVDRLAPEWKARRVSVLVRSRYRRMAEYWFGEDGIICAPTHWVAVADEQVSSDEVGEQVRSAASHFHPLPTKEKTP